jgi:hypothetical protein
MYNSFYDSSLSEFIFNFMETLGFFPLFFSIPNQFVYESC